MGKAVRSSQFKNFITELDVSSAPQGSDTLKPSEAVKQCLDPSTQVLPFLIAA